ncbi:DUF1259 domain-containing protein [Nitrospirillum amazonense]|uniref:Uncharacterized protein DUF1259 n=1 Tax=Nitrospirillum amazonense TaxID=28077 RepID=A0A560JE30_9PROT|nr:DUF1259 domain-containing protein [Nitrospirillum amazonense]MDG3439155.1 DUF1259 domain-containing protein [Nitrospirillum amazonense]TWB67584.1 uncharacterized protein DUF1259 [Nitrospirillum amazonense]
MNTHILRAMAVAAMAAAATPGIAADTDWTAVGQALGKAVAVQPDGVYKVGLPRTDLAVTLDGVAIKPTLALGSWLAFKETAQGQAMVMGDLVLTQDEVNPVAKELEDGGIQITALHNHLLRAQPATLYMHVDGHGDAVKLATVLHDALAKSKTPLAAPAAAPAPAAIDLDTAALDKALGYTGKVNGGVYQVTIPRAEAAKAGGMEIPPSMGAGIAINFQPTGAGKAAITGDFVLIASEVNPVIKALRDNGIEITALHNHMLDDEPRLFFMHFWANDDAVKLARGLHDALAQMKVAHS